MLKITFSCVHEFILKKEKQKKINLIAGFINCDKICRSKFDAGTNVFFKKINL